MSGLLFGIKMIKNGFIKLMSYIGITDWLIKTTEYSRGLYRYPSKMLGREFKLKNIKNHTDILVFAAHPDDDVLGLSTTLYRHRLNDDNITVIFVTNGSKIKGESWREKVGEHKNRSELRYKEAVQALSLIEIPKENIFCLGYPDGGTQRYLKQMAIDVLMLIQELNPRRVYVHCIEGGHCDHDITSFVVKSICKKVGYFNVFEWTQYNRVQPIGTQNVKFLPPKSCDLKEIRIDISEEERILKRKMLAFHESQDVEKYFCQGEAIRQANFSELEIDLNKYCLFPKRRLLPKVKSFYKSIDGGKIKVKKRGRNDYRP